MNLVLLEPGDLIADSRARLSGRRCDHITGVLGAGEGDEVAAGMLNGRIGRARIVRRTGDDLELDFRPDRDPPPALPVTFILALPRPKVLRRALFSLTVLGVKRIVLVNAARVEKSYWQTPFLAADAVRRQFLLGLEQACDTKLPELLLKRRFRPFAEDELPGITGGSLAVVAHPSASASCPRAVGRQVTLAVGPEGGFVPFEIELLESRGFQPVSLGERVLNVETAIPSLLARLL
jgi:RsmE family RNA methyltransferase